MTCKDVHTSGFTEHNNYTCVHTCTSLFINFGLHLCTHSHIVFVAIKILNWGHYIIVFSACLPMQYRFFEMYTAVSCNSDSWWDYYRLCVSTSTSWLPTVIMSTVLLLHKHILTEQSACMHVLSGCHGVVWRLFIALEPIQSWIWYSLPSAIIIRLAKCICTCGTTIVLWSTL